MYAPSYGGFGPMNSSQPFNPNGPQNPHQQHQQPGHPQHMMYNPQAYPAPAGPYGTGAPAMGGGGGVGENVGGMGMMQNSGLAVPPGGPMSQYQTPYTSSPYGANIPTSTTSNLPQNYMNTTSNGPPFPMMNAPNMNPQQNRMQPPPTSSIPNPRASPYGAMGTPPNAAGTQQSQFSTPQNPPSNIQTSNQPQGGSQGTPQTPNFPPGSQGAGGVPATPLSPGSESREKERVTVLLYINSELLMESARLQAVQAAEKEKETAATADGATESEATAKERSERAKALGREYVECMRRLQGNLAYLAAIADRSHKPSSQIPAHPQVISAPPLTPRTRTSPKSSPKPTTSPPSSDTAVKLESNQEPKKEEEKKDPATGSQIGELDDVDRPERLKDLYKKLQALFPGVDPKKEQTMQQMNAAAMRARAQAQAQQQAQSQGQQGQGLGQSGQGQGQQAQGHQGQTQQQQAQQQQAGGNPS